MLDIPGCDGKYAATRDGKIWSHRSNKFLKPLNNKRGYYYVSLFGKPKYIHRLIAQTYLTNPEGKLFINHKDNNPSNNKIDNLEWCTAKENTAQIIRLGRNKFGEGNHFAKLTVDQVKKIRELRASGLNNHKVANMFGVHWTTVSMLHNRRKIWLSVK